MATPWSTMQNPSFVHNRKKQDSKLQIYFGAVLDPDQAGRGWGSGGRVMFKQTAYCGRIVWSVIRSASCQLDFMTSVCLCFISQNKLAKVVFHLTTTLLFLHFFSPSPLYFWGETLCCLGSAHFFWFGKVKFTKRLQLHPFNSIAKGCRDANNVTLMMGIKTQLIMINYWNLNDD